MGKKENKKELITLLVLSLTHKIGSRINKSEIYAEKYAKEYENFLNMVKKVNFRENWNIYDKKEIKAQLKNKLKKELGQRDFLDNEKFKVMGEEMKNILRLLNLN